MFPWMQGGAGGAPFSLLSMLQGGGAQGPYGNMFQPGYWDRVNATRQPGEQNANVWLRGVLPQAAWPQQWRDPKYGYQGDRSDQTPQGNQSDTGNSMAPPGQVPPGGPDNTPMSGYDYNTVSPGYAPPPWMRMLSGLGGGTSRRPNSNQAMNMGLFGLSMLHPRPPSLPPGPYPWI